MYLLFFIDIIILCNERQSMEKHSKGGGIADRSRAKIKLLSNKSCIKSEQEHLLKPHHLGSMSMTPTNH